MSSFDQRGQKVKKQTNVAGNQYTAGRDPVRVTSGAVEPGRAVFLVVTIGVFIAGMAMAGIGAYLVYLGSTGSSEFSFFGQQFKSSNVGVAAIFIGAAMIVLVLRRLLKSFDRAISTKAPRE